MHLAKIKARGMDPSQVFALGDGATGFCACSVAFQSCFDPALNSGLSSSISYYIFCAIAYLKYSISFLYYKD